MNNLTLIDYSLQYLEELKQLQKTQSNREIENFLHDIIETELDDMTMHQTNKGE